MGHSLTFRNGWLRRLLGGRLAQARRCQSWRDPITDGKFLRDLKHSADPNSYMTYLTHLEIQGWLDRTISVIPDPEVRVEPEGAVQTLGPRFMLTQKR
jgi:hypothetical protein